MPKINLLLSLTLVFLTSVDMWGQSNCVAVPSNYTITDLGTLGGSTSFAAAVNASGMVTGSSYLPGDTVEDAFLWTPTGGMQDLGRLNGTFSGGNAINSAGDVVGYADLSSNGPTHAFLWTSSGGIQDLGTLIGPSGYSYAFGIDDHNRIVGNSQTSTSVNGHATLWVGSAIHDLGTISGDYSVAYAINNRFQITGTSSSSTILQAFLWTKSGGFKTLGHLSSSDSSVPESLNNFGMAAGYNTIGIGAMALATVWQGAKILNIGTLGGSVSTAYAVNDQCQVVGYSILSDTTTEHAFIWTKAGGIQDLNNLIPPRSGWTLITADGMNASGQIVGQGTINRQGHGYLLTPGS